MYDNEDKVPLPNRLASATPEDWAKARASISVEQDVSLDTVSRTQQIIDAHIAAGERRANTPEMNPDKIAANLRLASQILGSGLKR